MEEKSLNQLMIVLEQEKATYAVLLECAQKKRGYIIQNDVDALLALTNQENEQINSASKLSRERSWLSAELAAQAGLEAHHVRLGQLIEKMPGTYPVRTAQIRTEFLELVEQLNRENETNHDLIKAQLRFVDSAISYISQVGVTDNNYNQAGMNVDSPERIRLIDTSV